ncbi:hypothetical protein FDO65_15445 [Nakamurella flava]|uniref:GGDEF domain-containing protein n=1 Tax=Nakamurella flava TaxID=2576308 RepID=A0A4U6QF52_9ACTN|nr:hypothetical protein [Nakamurella flava]TKV58884.1 hypothetical protein FDO65_15445 [Nakamurella flava]
MSLALDPFDPSTPHRGDGPADVLRRRWFEMSAAGPWTFHGDWHDAAVDALCEACAAGQDVWVCAERLGAVRAAAGIGLAETLADIDALVTVAPSLPADLLCRAVSLGWADRSQAPAVAVLDPLTGLTSADYLRQRLTEVYRAAEVVGRRVSAGTALVVVRTAAGGPGWSGQTSLIVAAHALRTVFDAGQTLARLDDRVAVALTARDRVLPRRVQLLGGVMESLRPQSAPDSQGGPPRIWIEKLPDDLDAAVALVEGLGR